MGHLAAEDMRAHASEDQALYWHLTSNHFPPIGAMLPAAKEALRLARQGEWDSLVSLPDGATWRGKSKAPVRACVEAWHLDCFLDPEDE